VIIGYCALVSYIMHINQERIFVLIASFALEYKHYCLNRNSTCFLFLNWSWLYVWLYICLRMWLVSNLFSTTVWLQVTAGHREFAYCGLVLSHGLLLHIGFYNSLRLSLLYRSVQEKNAMLCLWTNVESRSINMHTEKLSNSQPSRPNKLGQYTSGNCLAFHCNINMEISSQ